MKRGLGSETLLAYEDLREINRQIEIRLRDWISLEELTQLRNYAFDFAEEKGRQLEFSVHDKRRSYLHVYVRYELMSEAQEYLLGFGNGKFDVCSKLVNSLLENNDLEYLFGVYGEKVGLFKSSLISSRKKTKESIQQKLHP